MKYITQLLALLIVSSTMATAVADLKPYTGKLTPALELSDLKGKTHNLQDYKNQVVLVQFWATYCPPCIKEMPSMNRLMKKMGDIPFTILAVNMGETQAEVEEFVAKVKPEFTILMDESGESINQWQVFAAPSSFIIGADGKVHFTLYGGTEWDSDEIVSTLKKLAPASKK